MAIDQGILDAVANVDVKANAEAATQDLIAHRNRLNILAEKSLAKSLEAMDTTSIPEGLGLAAAGRSDLAKVMAELGSIVATLQQNMKGAQSTLPETGQG